MCEHGSDVEDEARRGHLLEPIARGMSERRSREGRMCKGEARLRWQEKHQTVESQSHHTGSEP